MKYVLVILDGALDDPLPELGERTPLMVATGEHLKALARKARIGAVRPLPHAWSGDPEASLVALLGYTPAAQFTGRGPFDAADLQIDLDRADVAFRLHLVQSDGATLLDATAGRFPGPEGSELIRHLQSTLRHRTIQFFPGSGFRHVMVWRGGPDGLACTSPHDIQGAPLKSGYPSGDRAEELVALMWDCAEILADHRYNRRRRDEGKPAADLVWPWSPGRMPELQGFGVRHGIGGACVAGNPMVRGLARAVGLKVLDVPGATGSLDTDYAMKARAALSALREFNFCLVHLESPNEAGLNGDWEAKVDALRRVDERFFGTLLDRIGLLDNFRILVVVDHATPVRERKPRLDWMPFMLAGNQIPPQKQGILPFDERALEDTQWRIEPGGKLLDVLFDPTAGS